MTLDKIGDIANPTLSEVSTPFSEVWDTTSEWDAGTHTRTSARASLLEPGYRDDHDDGTIDPELVDANLDSGGEDEGSTVTGAYWYDFNQAKTTRVLYEGMDISGYDFTVIYKLEHTNTGTGEGDPQITACWGDAAAASANIAGAQAWDNDQDLRNVWISSSGSESSTDLTGTVKTAGDVFWLKLVYDNSASSYTSYYATSDPFSGGSWSQIGSESEHYNPKYYGYAGDDGDGAIYYSYVRPSDGNYQTEWRDAGGGGGSASLDDLTVTCTLPGTYSVNYTVKTSDDASTVKGSTSGTLADGTNTYDVSGVVDGQYVAVAFTFSASQLDTTDAPTIDSAEIAGTE